jgi:hypothetical protein
MSKALPSSTPILSGAFLAANPTKQLIDDRERTLCHFSLFVADILLLSPFLGEGLGVKAINHLCHYFRKMVLARSYSRLIRIILYIVDFR